ncbi:MAG: AI-2E family transporter [Gemmatimonadales bacterium]|nr:AI-2E family transporter [Gemmatimonadales bacterium]
MTPATRRRMPGLRASTMLLIGIFLILLTAALRLGAGLLLPIAIAALFTLLLDPPVRALRKLGLSTALGAALVVFGTLGVLVTGVTLLAGPAAEWVETAPKTLTQVQTKLRRMLRPLRETAQRVDQATQSVTPGAPPTVQIKAPGLLQRLSGSTTTIAATVLTVMFLTYFLLATLPVFRKKLADLIGTRAGARSVEEVLAEIEVQMSRYMLLNTLTSVGVGLATWGFLAVVGLPNSLLWGVTACLLNFIPYAGALVTTALVGVAALVSFDSTGTVLLLMGGCVVINLLEGNLVTPHLMGKHLPLNPVAIFLSLLYWGWVWGPAGTLLAVPITVMLQVIFSRIERLKPLAVLLDS